MTRKRILFAGYAPVHFVCFLPVYRRLLADPRLRIFLSGGFKEEDERGVGYRLEGFYDPFAVDGSQVTPLDEIRKESFDVLVCSHLSDDFFPGSVGKAVQIFHGVSFKNLAVREKALRYDILCLPGRYHAELYLRSGLVRPNGSSCLVTGFPKCDALVSGELDRGALLGGMGLDLRLPTVLFAPTGEKHNALEDGGEEVIRSLAAAGAFNVLVKPHDHPKHRIDWFARLASLEGDRVRLVREKDVIPFLHAADVLLTDASSVAVEYTLLDRPIVFLDSPRLFEKVQRRSPAMDLVTYGRRIGTIVERPEEAARAVEDALAHPERERPLRMDMARQVFHGPGSAAARVSGVILHAAGLLPALPDGVEVLESRATSALGAPLALGPVAPGG